MDEPLGQMARKLVKSTLNDWDKHKFLSASDEIPFLLLKGHLLVEDRLEQLINTHFAREIAVKELNLNFARKAVLAEAICDLYFHGAWWNRFLWPAVRALNTARNEIAHQLESEKLNDLIATLVRVYDDLGKLHEASFKQETNQQLPRVPSAQMTDEIKLRALITYVLHQLDELTVALVVIAKTVFSALAESGMREVDEAFRAMASMAIEEKRRLMIEHIDEYLGTKPSAES